MKTMKSVYIALFGTLLLVAGSVSVWAQAAQQTGDQTKSDSTAAAKAKKKKKADADASASNAASNSNAASSKKKTTPKKADAADKSEEVRYFDCNGSGGCARIRNCKCG